MNMHIRNMLAALAFLLGASAAQADVVVKANNTNALNLGTSWIGGVAPGANDIAQWDYNVTNGPAYAAGQSLALS